MSIRTREDRTSMITNAYRRYTESLLEFLAIAESCTLKGWPDRKPAIANTYRLQRLHGQCMALRLDYVLETRPSENAMWKSISDIFRRLTDHWKGDEESNLRERSLAYSELLAEIARCETALSPSDTEEPLRMASSDPEYLRARQVMQHELHSLDEELTHSS